MSNFTSLERKINTARKRNKKIKLRKHLNADTLIKKTVRGVFEKIEDHRTNNFKIPLVGKYSATPSPAEPRGQEFF